MSFCSENGEQFYALAMDLFFRAGHTATSEPEFINHSSERFVFFDNKSNVSLSSAQRKLLKVFNNVSRLFSYNGCIFFSINLQTSKNNRSQAAHDIHSMIHPLIKARGSICLFHWQNEVLLSFAGFGFHCILSDWYSENDDNDELLDKLHIANMSINRKIDYFQDMVYSLARSYYFLSDTPSVYDLIPINIFSGVPTDEIDREELNHLVENELLRPQHEYGDDYVDYDDFSYSHRDSISADLDLMLLEMDDADEDIGNPFGEDIEVDDDDEEEDEEFFNDDIAFEQDEYEFDDVDPEIFNDPTLMVKWLKKGESTGNEDSESSMTSYFSSEGKTSADSRRFEQERRTPDTKFTKVQQIEHQVPNNSVFEHSAREASEKAETERKAREAAEKADAERKAREAAEKAEAEREIREAAERAEAERKAREAAEEAIKKNAEEKQRAYEKAVDLWKQETLKAEIARRNEISRIGLLFRDELSKQYAQKYAKSKATLEQQLIVAHDKKAHAEETISSLGLFKFNEKKTQLALIAEADIEINNAKQALADAEIAFNVSMGGIEVLVQQYVATQMDDVARRIPLPTEPEKPI